MEEVVLNKTNFDKQLQKIDELSTENSKLPELKKFQEKQGPFELFSKHVKGEEMNEFANQVQDNFIVLNNRINQSFKQFIEIYKAFDSLDKEYIAGIVASIKQSMEAMKKAELAQQDVNNTIKILEITVSKLKEFNSKVNSELSRIDSENWKENALKHQKELDEIDEKANNIIACINEYKNEHDDLVKQLEEYKQEKKKFKKTLNLCWVTTGCMFAITVVLMLLNIL